MGPPPPPHSTPDHGPRPRRIARSWGIGLFIGGVVLATGWTLHLRSQSVLHAVLDRPDVRDALAPPAPPPPRDPSVIRLATVLPETFAPHAAGYSVPALYFLLQVDPGSHGLHALLAAVIRQSVRDVLAVVARVPCVDALGEDPEDTIESCGQLAAMGLLTGDRDAAALYRECRRICLADIVTSSGRHRPAVFLAVNLLHEEAAAVFAAHAVGVLPVAVWDEWTARRLDETALYRALLQEDLAESVLPRLLRQLRDPGQPGPGGDSRAPMTLWEWCRGGAQVAAALTPLLQASRTDDWHREVPPPLLPPASGRHQHPRPIVLQWILRAAGQPLTPERRGWSSASIDFLCTYLRWEGTQGLCALDGQRRAVVAADLLLAQLRQGRPLPDPRPRPASGGPPSSGVACRRRGICATNASRAEGSGSAGWRSAARRGFWSNHRTSPC